MAPAMSFLINYMHAKSSESIAHCCHINNRFWNLQTTNTMYTTQPLKLLAQALNFVLNGRKTETQNLKMVKS